MKLSILPKTHLNPRSRLVSQPIFDLILEQLLQLFQYLQILEQWVEAFQNKFLPKTFYQKG